MILLQAMLIFRHYVVMRTVFKKKVILALNRTANHKDLHAVSSAHFDSGGIFCSHWHLFSLCPTNIFSSRTNGH